MGTTNATKQANVKAGRGGIVPPVDKRFGQPNGNPRHNGAWKKEGLSTGLISLSKEENEIKRDKLKAWKRLKDKGFRFNRWTIPEEPKTPHIKLVIEAEMDVPDSPYDLDLLFGGEE